jgi:hypothetical protein
MVDVVRKIKYSINKYSPIFNRVSPCYGELDNVTIIDDNNSNNDNDVIIIIIILIIIIIINR